RPLTLPTPAGSPPEQRGERERHRSDRDFHRLRGHEPQRQGSERKAKEGGAGKPRDPSPAHLVPGVEGQEASDGDPGQRERRDRNGGGNRAAPAAAPPRGRAPSHG